MAARSENPFSRAFWLGSVDPRPLALFRSGLGLTLLHDLDDLTHDFRAFLTDVGMLPRGTVRDVFTWGLVDLVDSSFAVAALYALGVLAVIAFTVAKRRAPLRSRPGSFSRRSITATITSPTAATSSCALSSFGASSPISAARTA